MALPLRILFLLLLTASGAVSPLSEDRGGHVVVLTHPSQNIFRLKSFSDSFEVQLDPIHPDATVFISEQLFDGLVTLDSGLTPTPALADYWYKDYEGRYHRFMLRRGVRFHHGADLPPEDDSAELTAADVKFSMERILDPQNESPYAALFLDRVVGARDFYEGRAEEVSGFEAVDRYTFVIRWTKPYAMALSLLSMHFCKILPRDRVLEQGRGFFQRPSGTGPFRFRHWVRDNRLDIVGVQMERNPDYFGGVPDLDYVEFCPYYRLEDFLSGDVHAIPVVSERLLESEFEIIKDGSIHPFFLGMSCHLPPLDNPAVRSALAFGIDKPELIRATYEARFHRQLLHSFIPAKLPGFFLTDDINTYDPERARLRLQEAGFTVEASSAPLTLLMDYPPDDFKRRFYRELRRQLEDLGIRLEDEYYRSPERAKDFDRPYLLLISRRLEFPGPEDIIRPLFASDSSMNLIGYVNDDLDGLLEAAEFEKSWSDRNKLFFRIQKILNSEMPAVPLFTQQNQVAVQPFVQGIKNPPLGFYYLKMKNIRVVE